MISYAEVTAVVMLTALVVYALTGGADFGSGVWQLLAFGARAKQQRLLIDKAIAPIWEANHVWLILIVVLLFACFPAAYAAASIALYIPLTLLLIGIVLRGAGFAFRQHAATRGMRRRWSRLFAMASGIAPFFLGICLSAATAGQVDVRNGVSVHGFIDSWFRPFCLIVGALTVVLFAFLAALYLANETRDPSLVRDFRGRAVVAGVMVAVIAWTAIATAPRAFRESLLGSWWSWPLQITTGIVALATFVALYAKHFSIARFLGALQTILILAGWAFAESPMLIAPRLTIENAASPPSVIHATLVTLLAGSVLLAPSFYYLFRVFKGLRISLGHYGDKEAQRPD